MKKIAHIIVFSLLLMGYGCQQTSPGKEGYGANETTLSEDQQTGGGQTDDSRRGADVSDNGGTMQDIATTNDSLHTPGAVGESEAGKATEKTQQAVGNSNTRGEAITTDSRTTKNKPVPKQ